ncbi:hypothetical protein DFJ74DRAFT_700985 [Hyaloraphidium curvatum]|nr:hypothetical protein DFJ74DRAFT_700985 [Hyaloraphidium curvatum]
MIELIPCLGARASESSDGPAAVRDVPDSPTDAFHPTAARVVVVFRSGDGLAGRSRIAATWIAVDVGDAAPPNTVIATTEKPLAVPAGRDAEWFSGNFSMSRPNAGWPAGKYRVDIAVDGEPAASAAFSVSDAGLGATDDLPRARDFQAVACEAVDASNPDEIEAPVNPTDTFRTDAETLFVVWRSKILAALHAAGEAKTIMAAWVAVDVGPFAPPGTVIDSVGIDLDQLFPAQERGKGKWYSGHFSLGRPDRGWPVGDYRTEIHIRYTDKEEQLAVIPFSIIQ